MISSGFSDHLTHKRLLFAVCSVRIAFISVIYHIGLIYFVAAHKHLRALYGKTRARLTRLDVASQYHRLRAWMNCKWTELRPTEWRITDRLLAAVFFLYAARCVQATTLIFGFPFANSFILFSPLYIGDLAWHANVYLCAISSCSAEESLDYSASPPALSSFFIL